jgi:regulator of protease activity HflC (stomatin/prohibitin superfamily)
MSPGSDFDPRPLRRIVPAAIATVLVLILAANCYYSVPAGHVAVATLFGKIKSQPYPEGFHFPVNPLYDFHLYDARQKTHFETAQVPSQDQLQTKIDVSVQYRIMAASAPRILGETGSSQQMIDVHLVPKLRSLVREQGKAIKRAEDFFLEETQEQLQTSLLAGLEEYLEPMGMEVGAVLIRDITLPPFIIKAIESKKEREQAVEREKAELERFRFQQQQQVAQAEARRTAAEQEAAQRRVLADAQAYEIQQIRQAIGDDPSYLKLQALEALKAISKDPSAKIYFMDGDSPQPLPLMHFGER